MKTIRLSLFLAIIVALCAGQGISIKKHTSPPVNLSLSEFDSLTYSTANAPALRVHHGSTADLHDLAGIDSITFGDRPTFEVAPSSGFGYDVRKMTAGCLTIGMAVWGPNWGWMGLGGKESVDGNGVRSAVDTAGISNTTAKLVIVHTARAHSQREMQFTYDLTADQSVTGANFNVSLNCDHALFGSGAVYFFRNGSVADTCKTGFPLGGDGFSGDADSLRIVSNARDTIAIIFNKRVTISTDNQARIQVAPANMVGGTKYSTTMRIRFPGTIVFYPQMTSTYQYGDLSNWFPYSVGENGTPIDLSFLNKDANGAYIPAGSHGFLKVSADSFVFDDGTSGRFWGVNVTAYAPKADDARIVQFAERLARLGVNVVRLHHLDSWWAPSNIDVNHPDGTTQHLDATNMARLDKCIYELKRHGIYIVLDPWVGRQFRVNDSVPGWEDMTGNFGLHPYVYFDKRIQDLTKLYLTQIWNRVNTYTGVAYKNEPAIILTEVINEGLFSGPTVEPYRTNFINLYKVWARANGADTTIGDRIITQNYGTDNLNFYMYVQDTYYKASYDFFRTLGVKVPINATNWSFWNWDMVPNTKLDFMDVHHYYGGDVIGAGNDLGGVWTEHSISAKSTPWGKMAKHAIWGKPLTISECGQNPPKIYRGAYYPSFAAMACFQGWDGITGYAYTQGASADTKLDTYGWESDPSTVAGIAAGSLIYRRQDVKRAQQTVVMKVPKSEWYILRWENGGEKATENLPGFNAAIETHRVVSVYGDTIPTALAGADVLDVNTGFSYGQPSTQLTSDTHEMWRDWAKGIGTINTPRTQSAFGKLAGQTLTTSDCSFSIDNAYASVVITSKSTTPLAQAPKLFLIASGQARNTGMAYNIGVTGVVIEGNSPVIAEPVTGTVSFRTNATALMLYPVNVNGTRQAGVAVPIVSGTAVVQLKAAYKTLFYEIE
jgi:hypothetical protein